MRYEPFNNIDLRGTREAEKDKREAIENLKDELGLEKFHRILKRLEEGEPLTEEEKASIEMLRKQHLH